MSESKNSSVKADTMKRLFESFVEQAKDMNLPLNVAIINLDKEDPTPISGNFNIKMGSVEDLNNSIKESNINKEDVSIGKEAIESKPTNRPKFK